MVLFFVLLLCFVFFFSRFVILLDFVSFVSLTLIFPLARMLRNVPCPYFWFLRSFADKMKAVCKSYLFIVLVGLSTSSKLVFSTSFISNSLLDWEGHRVNEHGWGQGKEPGTNNTVALLENLSSQSSDHFRHEIETKKRRLLQNCLWYSLLFFENYFFFYLSFFFGFCFWVYLCRCYGLDL